MVMMRQDIANPTLTPPTPAVCGNCGVEERRLLHHVRHRGIFRRLCTSCVLRLHPQSFCPTCFLVYERSPPSSIDAVSCFKCYSSSHPHCVGGHAASTPYICPPCANPNAPIFDAKKAEGGGNREIDKKAAKVLLAAAKISAASMSKAAAGARAEAERRAKEAAFTRKRAREALEHVAFLVAKERMRRRDVLQAEFSGSGNAVAQERNHRGLTATAVVEQNRIGIRRGLDSVDGPSEVSARLNAVGLRERQGFESHITVSGPQGNGVAMALEDNGRPRTNSTVGVGGRSIQNNDNERSRSLGNGHNNNAQVERTNNGLYSVGGELQHMQNNHGREENIASKQ